MIHRLTVLLCLLAITSPASAQMMGGAYDSDAQAYFNALSANSCTAPSAAFKRAVSTYIKAEKTAGNWDSQDSEYIFATTDSCTASINLAQSTLYKITWAGACTYSLQNGLNGDSSTCVGDAGVNQSALTRQSQNNGHIEAWMGNNAATRAIGLAATATTRLVNSPPNKSSQLNSATNIGDTGVTAGLNAADRTDSNTITTWLNGSTQSAGASATSAALVASHMLICETNGGFCGATSNILFVGWGAAMNSESSHYTNVRNLLLALGVTGI